MAELDTIPRNEWDNAPEFQERCIAINVVADGRWRNDLSTLFYEYPPGRRCTRPLGHSGPHMDGHNETW